MPAYPLRVFASHVIVVAACTHSGLSTHERGKPETGAQSGERCAELSRKECGVADNCRPLSDKDGAFYECIDGDRDCGDDETCASDGERLEMFASTCVPAGWQVLRHEECAIGCWLLPEDECERDARCMSILDSNDTFYECSVRRNCADAPVCGFDGEARYAWFPAACLPNGWSYAQNSLCTRDVAN